MSRRLLAKFGAHVCRQQIDWLAHRPNLRDKAAALRRSIEEEWAPPGDVLARLPRERPPAEDRAALAVSLYLTKRRLAGLPPKDQTDMDTLYGTCLNLYAGGELRAPDELAADLLAADRPLSGPQVGD